MREKKLAITFFMLGAGSANLLAGILLPHNLITGFGLLALIYGATGLFLESSILEKGGAS